MANVAHSTLTGSELHEPKGADTATLGTVYVADGAGSGSWANIGTSAFTGMIADFASPIAPAGWLELDGSVISTATYSGLFAVMSIPSSGTRANGSPVITSIPSTTNMRVGYYVFGTGIGTGLTILSVDSPTQITLSGNASSSGTSAIDVSPWLMNTGTVKLPDLTTAGRFRRSRTSSTKVGDTQADQNKDHTHSLSVSGTTSTIGDHYHAAGIYDPSHAHTYSGPAVAVAGTPNTAIYGTISSQSTSLAATGVRVNSSNGLDTTYSAGSHSHTVTSTGTSGSTGDAEARPFALVVMTCIKT